MAAVVTTPADVLAWWITKRDGVVPTQTWAEDGCAAVRAELREWPFPGALVFAMVPQEGRVDPPRLTLRAYCKGHGWSDTEVALALLESIEPQALCAGTRPTAIGAEVTIECYQPSGERIAYGDFQFSLRDGPEPRSRPVATLRDSHAQEIPPGTWWLRSSSNAVERLIKPCKIEVVEGERRFVRFDLLREVSQLRLVLRSNGKEIRQGHCLVDVRDQSGWIAVSMRVPCEDGLVVVPKGQVTLRVTRMGHAQLDTAVTVAGSGSEVVTLDLVPASDRR